MIKEITFSRPTDKWHTSDVSLDSICNKYKYHNPRLEKYEIDILRMDAYSGDYHHIDGWVLPEDIRFLDFISSIPFNQEGGICEIGVHCGKYFIPLNQLASDPTKEQYQAESLAVDLFTNIQNLNVSYSGGLHDVQNAKDLLGEKVFNTMTEGQIQHYTDLKHKFLRNLEKYDEKYRGKNVTLLEADSLTLTPEDLGIREYKFISVDGGHDVEHVQNDLRLVEKCIKQHGVVILDDWMNPQFSSVSEGYYNYKNQGGVLVPFASCNGKLYLCNYSVHYMYLEYLEQLKVAKLFDTVSGYKVVTILKEPIYYPDGLNPSNLL